MCINILPKELVDEFKIFLKIPVIERIGMTELSRLTFATNLHDLTNLTDENVIRDAKILFKMVQNLVYSIVDIIYPINCPAGEIFLKSSLFFKGCYKNDEENTKAFDKCGYFHTGDAIRLISNLGNGLKIFNKVKKYLNLVMENKLNMLNWNLYIINQVILNKLRLMVMLQWIVKNEENEDLKKLIIDELLKLVIEANFDGYEKVKYIINTFIRYTAENSSMTNTMKIVKKKFELRFKERTDKLYEFIPFK